MIKKLIIVLIILFAIGLGVYIWQGQGPSLSGTETATSICQGVYKSVNYGFEFQCPNGWQIIDLPLGVELLPPDFDIKDRSTQKAFESPSILVLLSDKKLWDIGGLDSWQQAAKERMSISGFVERTGGAKMVDYLGNKAFQARGSFSLEDFGLDENFVYYIERIIFPNDALDAVADIELACPEKFKDDYLPVYNKILSTFKFLE